MTLSELLRHDGLCVAISASSFEGVIDALLGTLPDDHLPAPADRAKCARDLAFGSRGEVVRFSDDVVLAGTEIEGLEAPLLLLATTAEPIEVSGEGREEAGEARTVLLLLAGRKLSALRARVAPVLRGLVSEERIAAGLATATEPVGILSLPGFLDTEIPEYLLVSSALEPVSYRVYPDTPIREILDLMARRGVQAVPVVGDQYEVLGVITSGDALGYLVPRARSGPGEEAVEEGTARDIMSRSVLCVTEDQALRDVAHQMVVRDVEQMPVVRDGELVGFVTRDTVLRTLFGPDESSSNSNDQETTR